MSKKNLNEPQMSSEFSISKIESTENITNTQKNLILNTLMNRKVLENSQEVVAYTLKDDIKDF